MDKGIQSSIDFAESFMEIVAIIDDFASSSLPNPDGHSIISESERETGYKKAIWYRGQANSGFHLIPKAYRIIPIQNESDKKEFSTRLYEKEEKYINDFIVRNHHLISDYPDNLLNWMSIMQHYGSPTRLLDWSESVFPALFFALEKYFTLEKKSEENLPCLWCLRPCELNNKINDSLTNEDQEKIVLNTSGYKNSNPIDYFIKLSKLAKKIEDGEVQSSLLEGYFHTGKPKTYPEYPLAIVASYNNDRIRAQAGVFTIFPMIDSKKKVNSMTDLCLDKKQGSEYFLKKIVILKPYRVSEQLKRIGMRRMYFYPELPSSEFDITQDLKEKYFI
jgi:hypothetical protein